jgi:hypothetical protein
MICRHNNTRLLLLNVHNLITPGIEGVKKIGKWHTSLGPFFIWLFLQNAKEKKKNYYIQIKPEFFIQ